MIVTDDKSKRSISSFRRYLPQALACFAKNILLVNVGLSTGLSAIIISALRGLNPANNPDEHLHISAEEASWIASILSFSMVLGSFITGTLDILGRKRAIILCNIPFLFGWLYLYYSTSVYDIYIVLGLFGLAAGLAESAIFNYIGELAEPNVRGILAVTGNFSLEVGSALVFALANKMPWRSIALVCGIVSMFGIFSMLFVPETPHWLLSRNRKEEALKSLQWLRGWVQASDVQIEFEHLQRYKARTHACQECAQQKDEKDVVICDHNSQECFVGRLRELFRRKNLIPFGVLCCVYANALFCGNLFRPYVVPILKIYKSPIDPNTVLVWVGYIGLATIFLTMICIRLFGKRIIHLTALALSVLTIYAMGFYGVFFLDHGQVDQHYFPVFAFLFMVFTFQLGLRSLPALLLSELFSYRCKSIGSGITVAISSISYSIFAKTFYSLEAAITLPAQLLLYATAGLFGFVIVYLVLPETEGRSLEDIEMYFSDKKRKFYDINIPKLSDREMINDH